MKRRYPIAVVVLILIALIVTLAIYFSKESCPRFGYKCPTLIPAATLAPVVAPASVLTAAPVALTMPPDRSTHSLALLLGGSGAGTSDAVQAFYFPEFKKAFLVDNKVKPFYKADGTKDPQWTIPTFFDACNTAYGDVAKSGDSLQASPVGYWAMNVNWKPFEQRLGM